LSTPTVPVSKAPLLGADKEQWVKTIEFSCVHCNKTFKERKELIAHYEATRHDKYSAWKA